MMMELPAFWIPFAAMLGVCIFLAWREDYVHGPQQRDQPENRTPRYSFCLEFAGRLIILAGLCAVMQALAWAMEAMR